jgi:hypothetical protein
VRSLPHDVDQLSEQIGWPDLCNLVEWFIYERQNPDAPAHEGQLME